MICEILFRCPHCGEGAALGSLPFCARCVGNLLIAPPLCPKCYSPGCTLEGSSDTCARPWAEGGLSPITSLSAAYLLQGKTFSVLKSWKKNRAWLSDRQVFRFSEHLWRELSEFRPEYFSCVPQRYKRAWQMGGGPTEALSRFLARRLEIPFVNLLSPGAKTSFRQGELQGEARVQNPIMFEGSPTIPPHSRLIWVDDFMTTGHTLRRSAQSLRAIGFQGPIHGMVLGLRMRHRAVEAPTSSDQEVPLPIMGPIAATSQKLAGI
ncbi:hypothetical protein WDW86_01385 [Bdellovibrionota bacterium FG-2]